MDIDTEFVVAAGAASSHPLRLFPVRIFVCPCAISVSKFSMGVVSIFSCAERVTPPRQIHSFKVKKKKKKKKI
jgi:hypothetical protein